MGLAISSTWPMRPMGFLSLKSALYCGFAVRINGVSIAPGATELTRIPNRAHSTPKFRVIWSMAALEAAYGKPEGIWVVPATELRFTIAAPPGAPCAFRLSLPDFNKGRAALESHMHDMKLVSKTLENSSLVNSSAFFRMLVPQLFTRISSSFHGSLAINSWQTVTNVSRFKATYHCHLYRQRFLWSKQWRQTNLLSLQVNKQVQQLPIYCHSVTQQFRCFLTTRVSFTPFSVDKSATIGWQRSGASCRTASSSVSPLAQIATSGALNSNLVLSILYIILYIINKY